MSCHIRIGKFSLCEYPLMDLPDDDHGLLLAVCGHETREEAERVVAALKDRFKSIEIIDGECPHSLPPDARESSS